VSAEGHLIAGRYRLHQRIGSGAMGVVWRAVDERLHRTVAVKQLLLQPGYTDAETEEARQRALREGRIAARLQHQNAIVVFDTAEDEGQPVLVMEYLPSKSLATVLADQGPLPPQTVARIGAQVAGALTAAHQAGIVHRDLKPGNILLGEDGVAKITDFGISRAIGDVSVTQSGILAGTPAYLSPEVALGRDPAPASDVFSLGSTLYAAIEGAPPFGVDENAISLLHRVARGQVDPPRNAGPMAPALMQLLHADPVDRPTMAQVRGIPQAVVEGRPIPTGVPANAWQQPASPPAATMRAAGPESGGTKVVARATPTETGSPLAEEPRRPSAFRRPALLWLVAVLVAIAIGILAATAYGKPSQPQPGPQPGTQPAAPAAPPPSSQQSPTATSSSALATSSSETPTSSTAAGEPTTGQPTMQEVEQTVRKYYSLVPHHPEQAWQMLGPSLQAQGFDAYQQWWQSIQAVQIVAGPKLAGSNVYVVLRYTTRDGRMSQETHLLGMVATSDGKPLINTDSLIG
jgi:serine/threonine protein kinase